MQQEARSFIINSHGQSNYLNLTTAEFHFDERLRVSTKHEGGVTVIELSDLDVSIELVVRAKNENKGTKRSSDASALVESSNPLNVGERNARSIVCPARGMQGKNKRSGMVADDANWMLRFDELVNYKNEFGDCTVPQKYVPNPRLGRWVNNQREQYNKHKLSEDRIKKLSEIGFSWGYKKVHRVIPWMTYFNELVDYKREVGNCNVPRDYPAKPRLGQWVQTQRHRFELGKLSEERITKLNEIEFPWEIEQADPDIVWMTRYNELVTYKQEVGDCNFPHNSSPNPQLGTWVIRQRANFKKGMLSDERVASLNAVGFAWEAKKSSPDDLWMTRYNKLIEYKQNFGTCNVSREYEANLQLFYWVKQQRSLFKQGRLAKERIDKLNEVGFYWGRLDFKTSWMSHYNELVNHKQEFGDCNVPCNMNSRLGEWTKNQRCLYNKGKLSQDRIDKLNEIGFVWGVRESQWMTHFYELKKFKRKFGHCDVPCLYKKNPQLGRWVENQRAFYRKGVKITEERIAMLNEAGFRWVIKDS